MRLTITRCFFCIIVAVLTSGTASLFGQSRVVQGFEAGDPAVTSTGDAGAKGSYNGQAPTQGTMQFLLTTVGMMTNEDAVGSQSGGFAQTNLSLQNFFGFNPAGVEGSGVLIPFTIQAGDTALNFNYNFLSNEPFQAPAVMRNDFAFFALYSGSTLVPGSVMSLATVNGSSFTPDMNPSDAFQFFTGYLPKTISLAGLAPGNYTLGFGVEDAGPGAGDHASGLLIDNVQIVPEPSVFALAIIGAGLLVGAGRRIKRA
jgi:hypothetical protein